MKSLATLFGQILAIALGLGLVFFCIQSITPSALRFSLPWETLYVVLLYLSLFLLIKSYSKSHAFPMSPGPLRSIGLGFLASTLILSSSWGIGLFIHALTWEYQSLPLLQLAHILGLAFAIAWFEEALFRGLIFQLLCKAQRSPFRAMLLQSFIFAGLHQLNSQWDFAMRVGSGIGLFLCAFILTQARVRSGHLGWSVGLHGGWIFLCQWAAYSGAITPQITGNHWQNLSFQEVNPVSGIVGILLLTGVSYVIMRANRTQEIMVYK